MTNEIDISASDTTEADALFVHMQELVDTLSAMEEKGTRLARARVAREVVRLERYRKGQENELRYIQENFDAQLAAERAAKEAGDAEAEKAARCNVLGLGNQKGIRQGAEMNAAHKVKEALAAGGFVDLDEAREAGLEDAEFFSLEQEVEAFKADYAQTLAACQAVVDEESGDE